ncbi:MAG TPA: hypothetical protein VHZ52_08170 [Acidobacteriaceae bacterium]|jgi:hypothetical protein|nr:hypothetical protein [Acidobacteriaceae bacterium]
MAMADFGAVLSNPIAAFVLRAALGAYIVYMARGFYADPFAYFRKWMPRMHEEPAVRKLIRALACFCVWGGCFIVATAVATQIFGLHGLALAYALVTLAAIATWFLLPKPSSPLAENGPGNDRLGRME